MAFEHRGERKKCLIRGCRNSAQFRGLCQRCHQATRRAIRDGLTSETELIEQKMLLPSIRGRNKKKSPWELQFERSRRSPRNAKHEARMTNKARSTKSG